MRPLTSSRPAWSASSTARAATTSYSSSVRSFHGSSRTVSSQVRIQPTSGDCSDGALELADLGQRGVADVLGQVGLLDALAVVGLLVAARRRARRSSLRIAASCWRSRNSRCWRSIPPLTSCWMVSATSSSARCSRVHSIVSPDARRCRRSPGAKDFCVGQVRRIPGEVGDRLGLGGLPDRVDDLPGAAPLEEGDDQAAVLLGPVRAVSSAAGAARRSTSTHRAEPGPVTPAPIRTRWTTRTIAAAAAGQPPDLLDDGLHADTRPATVETGARTTSEARRRRPGPTRRPAGRPRCRRRPTGWARPCPAGPRCRRGGGGAEPRGLRGSR